VFGILNFYLIAAAAARKTKKKTKTKTKKNNNNNNNNSPLFTSVLSFHCIGNYINV
jgi:hypothetical protein